MSKPSWFEKISHYRIGRISGTVDCENQTKNVETNVFYVDNLLMRDLKFPYYQCCFTSKTDVASHSSKRMKKIVACIQSSYIPWKGYFDQIGLADEFIFYDDVQYTKEDWRNRNKVKTPRGSIWLTVPCGDNLNRLIFEVKITNDHWQKKHWSTIHHNYNKTKFYRKYKDIFEELYLGTKWVYLSELNQTFIRKISTEILGFKTKFRDSREFMLNEYCSREDRWLELLKKTDATDFIIGPNASNYLDRNKIQKIYNAGIKLHWMNYDCYPEYNQLFPPFDHHISIIDLIFNEGQNATNFMMKNSPKCVYI